jgi:hypothetical protein
MSDGVLRQVQVDFVLSGEMEEAEQTLEAKVKNNNHPSKDSTSTIVTYVFSAFFSSKSNTGVTTHHRRSLIL